MTLRDRPGGVDGEVNHRRWDLGWPSLGVSARAGMYPMTTTTAPESTAIAVTEPVLAGWVGGSGGGGGLAGGPQAAQDRHQPVPGGPASAVPGIVCLGANGADPAIWGSSTRSDTVRFCSLRTPVPLARPPDYDQSSARRDHQASAAVIAPSASRMPSPTSPAVAAQCRGTRARAPGSHRCSSRVNGSGAVLS